MESAARGVILVLGADLLGRTRIEETVERSGFTPRPLAPNKLSEADMEAVRGILADVDSDEVLDAVTAMSGGEDLLRVGFYAHVDRARAERVKTAGWQAMPRGRLFRELPEILADL